MKNLAKLTLVLLTAPLRIAWTLIVGVFYLILVTLASLIGVSIKAAIVDSVISEYKKD